MIFNKDVLFIHLGKTGGISVTNYLANVLKPWVIEVTPQFSEKQKITGKAFSVKGKRHGNLQYASKFLAKYGISISDFKLIFIVVRNPVDLEFSFYNHLKKSQVQNRRERNQKGKDLIALSNNSFEEFALSDATHYSGDLAKFFEVDGKQPSNLKVVKFEKFSTEIPELIAPYSTRNSYNFPHKNKTCKTEELPSLTKEALKNIQLKYKYFYENGFY